MRRVITTVSGCCKAVARSPARAGRGIALKKSGSTQAKATSVAAVSPGRALTGRASWSIRTIASAPANPALIWLARTLGPIS